MYISTLKFNKDFFYNWVKDVMIITTFWNFWRLLVFDVKIVYLQYKNYVLNFHVYWYTLYIV